jgi:hypothetical protein
MSLMTVSMAIMIVYTLQRLHNFTHRSVISSLAKRLKVSILPNVHFLWCTPRRSPQSPSQCFLARKTSTLRFYHCGLHHPTKAPSCVRLGLHHPSPKVRITPSFSSTSNIRETGKTTCYLTKPTHINHMLCAVNMVTHFMNRSLGSLAGTTTIQNST